MNVFEWADHHWIVVGISAVLLASSVCTILEGVAARIRGTCGCEPCGCPPGCHEEDDEEDAEESAP